MTLDDKRKVIKVLLCCGDIGHGDGTMQVSYSLGFDRRIQRRSFATWAPVQNEPQYVDDWSREGRANAYTESAYRLIETSATLRREWFGAR